MKHDNGLWLAVGFQILRLQNLAPRVMQIFCMEGPLRSTFRVPDGDSPVFDSSLCPSLIHKVFKLKPWVGYQCNIPITQALPPVAAYVDLGRLGTFYS